MLAPIEDSIDQLFRFSRAIHRSGVIRKFVKLVNYVEYSSSGVNLSEEFSITVRQVVDPLLKGTAISHEIEGRLIETICLRRQNFQYLKARKAQQAPRPEEPARPSYVKSALPFPTQIARAKPPFRSQYLARAKHSVINRSVPSSMNQEAEILGNDSWVPQPPAVPLGQEEWECPYCLQVCSAEEFNRENWKYVKGLYVFGSDLLD